MARGWWLPVWDEKGAVLLDDNDNDIDKAVEKALLECALGGNTTALIFWLKNRRPDVWRDKPEGAIRDDGLLAELLECWSRKRDDN